MHILHFEGGLGNQMFQFAYFRYLETFGYNIKFDIYSPSSKKHGGFRLFHIFPNIPTENVLPYFYARSYFLYGDFLKKVLKVNKTTNGVDVMNPVIPKNKIWIRGHWQTYKYMTAIESQLKKDFVFAPITDSYNTEMAAKISETESVSVHVRRGDYLKPKVRISLGNICTLDYYSEAISIINNKVKNPHFFIFSDDIEWASKNLNLPNASYINNNIEENSFRDMQLMSLCKHNIIANSTFSWWGAWLNSNENKIIVIHKKWIHNNNSIDLIPDNWYKAGNNTANISLIIRSNAANYLDYILAQTYHDFELLTNSISGDSRVKPVSAQPEGNYIFEIAESELPKFANKNYLKNKLLQ